ncbi:glycosyltransferase family 2 protein [Desulfonauticus submarinus]
MLREKEINQCLELFFFKKYNLLIKLFGDIYNEKISSLICASYLRTSKYDKLLSYLKNTTNDIETLQIKTAQYLKQLQNKKYNTPLVDILLLTYNREKYVENSLKELAKTDYPNYRLFIVDNGSTDQTWEKVKNSLKYFPPHVKIFYERLPTNIGRPAGHNWLLTKYNHDEAKYIALADDDLIKIPSNWLWQMVKIMEDFPSEVVAVGGKALSPGFPPKVHGGVRNFIYFSENDFKLSNEAEQLDVGQFDFITYVDHVIGCLQLYKTEIFSKLGLFDIRFSPVQLVDIEHHLRCRLNGYKIVFNGLIEFIHQREFGKKCAVKREFIGNSLGNKIKLIYKYNPHDVNIKLNLR